MKFIFCNRIFRFIFIFLHEILNLFNQFPKTFCYQRLILAILKNIKKNNLRDKAKFSRLNCDDIKSVRTRNRKKKS